MNFLGIDWYAEANVLLTEAIATTWQNKRFKRTMALHMYYDKSPLRLEGPPRKEQPCRKVKETHVFTDYLCVEGCSSSSPYSYLDYLPGSN